MSGSEFVQMSIGLAPFVFFLITIFLFRKQIRDFLNRMNKASTKIGDLELALSSELEKSNPNIKNTKLTETEKELINDINWDKVGTLIRFVDDTRAVKVFLVLAEKKILEHKFDFTSVLERMEVSALELNLGTIILDKIRVTIQDSKTLNSDLNSDAKGIHIRITQGINFIDSFITALAEQKEKSLTVSEKLPSSFNN